MRLIWNPIDEFIKCVPNSDAVTPDSRNIEFSKYVAEYIKKNF